MPVTHTDVDVTDFAKRNTQALIQIRDRVTGFDILIDKDSQWELVLYAMEGPDSVALDFGHVLELVVEAADARVQQADPAPDQTDGVGDDPP